MDMGVTNRKGIATQCAQYHTSGSFPFHINQSNNSWDTTISKFDLQKSKVKFMGEV